MARRRPSRGKREKSACITIFLKRIYFSLFRISGFVPTLRPPLTHSSLINHHYCHCLYFYKLPYCNLLSSRPSCSSISRSFIPRKCSRATQEFSSPSSFQQHYSHFCYDPHEKFPPASSFRDRLSVFFLLRTTGNLFLAGRGLCSE